MSKITWINSYLKSGSNWCRFVMDEYIRLLYPKEIDETGWVAPGLHLSEVHRQTGINPVIFTNDELDELTPDIWRKIAGESSFPVFVKTHGIDMGTPSGKKLYPGDISQGVIYLIRNPFDLAVSYSHHFDISLEQTVENMGNAAFEISGGHIFLNQETRARISSWSGNIRFWTEQTRIPVVPLRYEDLLSNPEAEFSKAIRIAGLKLDRGKLKKAVHQCSLSRLRKKEKENGMPLVGHRGKSFFRKGRAGYWKDELPPELADRLAADHGDMLVKLGYMDAAGGILV